MNIKVEIVRLPIERKWNKYIEQVKTLEDGQALKITGLNAKEINTLRQAAYRELEARCIVRREEEEKVLYLYNKKKKEV